MSPKDTDARPGPLFEGSIRPDQKDIRDRYYEPTLARLSTQRPPDFRLLKSILAEDRPLFPRDQGDEGTCGGHSLAALIDIERLRASRQKEGPPPPVSARMIHTMARQHDDSNRRDDGVSLRDVIKGFFNYGVCRDEDWPYVPKKREGNLTKPRADAARAISLGAYFRLRPNLNDYHAAISETGAVLVSAELHDGWGKLFVTPGAPIGARERAIPTPDFSGAGGQSYVGGHAFVVVGYDERGFLILNSWGKDWGYHAIGGIAYTGIAHWPYADWADSVMDGWVLRLGVGAAEAFQYSVGEQGLGGANGRVRATPVHAVLGHYLHTDDGRYVERGAFASSADSIEETFKVIKGKEPDQRYKGLLLTFAGGLLNLNDAVAQIAQTKTAIWRDRQTGGPAWYPMTALWCADYVEEVRSILAGVFNTALAQIGAPGEDLDRMIEDRGHGVGRALWRDILRAAERTVRSRRVDGQFHDGPFLHLLAEAAAVHRLDPDFGLRIFTEGAGIFVLCEVVAALADRGDLAPTLLAMLRSVDMIAPAIEKDEFEGMVRSLAGHRRRLARGAPPLALRLHLPSDADETRLAVPPYGRSYFDLVERTFLPRDGRVLRPKPTGEAGEEIGQRWQDWTVDGRVKLCRIEWPRETVIAGSVQASEPGKPRPLEKEKKKPANTGPILQRELIYKSDVYGRISVAIKENEPSQR